MHCCHHMHGCWLACTSYCSISSISRQPCPVIATILHLQPAGANRVDMTHAMATDKTCLDLTRLVRAALWTMHPLPVSLTQPPCPTAILQVIRLCEGSCLLSALTHIYNQMGDYRKPLLDLLASVAAAASWPAAQAAAYKLLVYLRCCFRGMAFPPGTGSLPRYVAKCALHAAAAGQWIIVCQEAHVASWLTLWHPVVCIRLDGIALLHLVCPAAHPSCGASLAPHDEGVSMDCSRVVHQEVPCSCSTVYNIMTVFALCLVPVTYVCLLQ